MNEFDTTNPIDDEEEIIIITLSSEDGEEIELELLDTIEYESARYAVLLPLEEDEEEGTDVIILLVENEGDDEIFSEVQDEKTLEAVFEIFKEHFADEIEFLE
jgi:GTPase SAR1 family protein